MMTQKPSHESQSTDKPLVIFDGVCHLCQSSVQFIIQRDPKGIFNFVPMQSSTAQKILQNEYPEVLAGDTVLLVEDGEIYGKSEAALRICRRLRGPWRWLWIFRYVPETIRDGIYIFIARNRYKWFGRSQVCMMPRPEWTGRFLD
jgi:predicted DCC family thiol-disulfide oxidoreductase YuxK